MARSRSQNLESQEKTSSLPLLIDCDDTYLLVEPPSVIPSGYELMAQSDAWGTRVGWGKTYTAVSTQTIDPRAKPTKHSWTCLSNERFTADGSRLKYETYTVVQYEFPLATSTRIEPQPPQELQKAVKEVIDTIRLSRPLRDSIFLDAQTPPANWLETSSIDFLHVLRPAKATLFTLDQAVRLIERLPAGSYRELRRDQVPRVGLSQETSLPRPSKSPLLSEQQLEETKQSIEAILRDHPEMQDAFGQTMKALGDSRSEIAEMEKILHKSMNPKEQVASRRRLDKARTTVQRLEGELRAFPNSTILHAQWETLQKLRGILEADEQLNLC